MSEECPGAFGIARRAVERFDALDEDQAKHLRPIVDPFIDRWGEEDQARPHKADKFWMTNVAGVSTVHFDAERDERYCLQPV